MEGDGVLDDLKETFQKTKKTAEEKIGKTKKTIGYILKGRNDAYPPSAKKVLDKYGESIIRGMELHRMVLPSVYNGILNLWTGGELEKRLKNQPKDKLFHISLWVYLDDVILRLEKNAVINIETNPKKPDKEEVQKTPHKEISVNEMLEKTRKQMGDKAFFSYSAVHNNCGHWIEAILKANGLTTQDTDDFIKQDTQEILKGFPALRKAMNTITDLAGKADVVLQGGSLKANIFQELLKASYKPKDKVGGFELDKSISSATSKVFYSPTQTVVAHRGTSGAADWATDSVYAYGGIPAIKLTPRYKSALKVQKAAEEKYGAKNITTIGHSLGGLLAELVGGNSKEILTFNKATRPGSNLKQDIQTDVSTTGDVVSSLNPFQKNKQVIIDSKTGNPITEHGLDTLNLGEQLIGGKLYSHVQSMESYLTPQAEAQRLSTMYGGVPMKGKGILDQKFSVRDVVDTGREFGGMFGRGYGGGLYASGGRIRGSGIPGPPSRSPITNAMF